MNIDDKTRILRGGAGNKQNETPLMIKQAIESGRKHGIQLSPGILNNADGNCSFESVLNNINHRDCFKTKLQLDVNTYRCKWVTQLENDASNFPNIGAGFSLQERKENWDRLKQSGVYEIPFFGDLVINGIAKGCNKNILIFNTSIEAADPIYVIKANEFGGFADLDIPVVLAYNQVHYESLHPETLDDIEKTRQLVSCYEKGEYRFNKNDISLLIKEMDNVECGKSSECRQEIKKGEQLSDKVKTKNNNASWENNKKKRKSQGLNIRKMTVEERRHYNREHTKLEKQGLMRRN